MRPFAFSKPNPDTDLVLERIVDIPRQAIWNAWTKPEQLVRWFTPAPWQTIGCEIDLQPGGIFRTVMRSPEGEESDSAGCFLVVEPPSRLVFTDALGPGFQPAMEGFFTAFLELEDRTKGTLYRVVARHKDVETCRKHQEMGFYTGWNAALDQLVAMVKTERT